MKDQEFRAYHFNSMYLPGIHTGIQSAHSLVELFLKYPRMSPDQRHYGTGPYLQLYEWAEKHKTMICLNGGYLSVMQELYEFFSLTSENPYPYAKFHESEDALGGIMTNVVIILPEKIFAAYAKLAKSFNRCEFRNSKPKTMTEYVECVEEAESYNRATVHHKVLRLYEDEYGKISAWEAELIDRLRGFRLAS